ncbi:MAG: 3-oxoacid CoA-transferase subunit B [Deltaproteobacteria bacterium]|nr:3-oxoacid CoA-transferase subunit B [Deltaproteobacteria bacterium]
MPWSNDDMARRAADEIAPGMIVNLGIGLPTLVAGYFGADSDVWFHSENGLLGMGPFPVEGEEDPQLINAGKQTVTVVDGGSTFDSALSFAMIRGKHVDLAILGAMQVAANGDLANWTIPGGRTMGIGGAMDLAAGARRVLVLMKHAAKSGEPKILERCTYPLTAEGVVDRIITDLGVLDVGPEGLQVVECAPDISLEDLRAATGAELRG